MSLSAARLSARRDEERREQARWKVREVGGWADHGDKLVDGEFVPREQAVEHQDRVLQVVLQHAARHVPYYVGTLAGVDGPPRVRLAALPVLSKADLQTHQRDILATSVPPGHEAIGETRTSGSTGEPTVVRHSAWSMGQFSWLKQRELRWFRVDPMGRMAAIRPMVELPRRADGELCRDGEAVQTASWPGVGRLFETGPFVGITNTNPVQAQLAFLRHVDPDLLILQAGGLEHLALASGAPLGGRLRVVQAISQTLTPSMRATAESLLGVQVVQNYGLNEIGLVASRCVEGGRYHVHSEHALVELVDEEGRAVAPGERGRLVVTTMTNLAMPLLRYDTGDWAVAVDGPCACGRTLPAFGEVLGRYRRVAFLPEGTWPRWGAVQTALGTLPPGVRVGLRGYQVRQHADGHWELRVDHEGEGFDALEAAVRAGFAAGHDSPAPALVVLRTDVMEGRDRRKFESFLSDFVPPPDGHPA